MAVDLQAVQVLVAVTVGVLTILGTIFGWFGKAWRWGSLLLGRKPGGGVTEIPSQTLVLMSAMRHNALWWHMGSSGDKPAMQIVGDLKATNISKMDIEVMGAKLRKPKAVGHAFVTALDSHSFDGSNRIPEKGVRDLRFDFFAQPPICEAGKPFKGDIAIVDQFGNEHWLKGLEFSYQ